MQKRKIGKSGLEVAPLALGGNVFGWTIDETTSFEILDRFVGAGFNLIDTADVYSRWKTDMWGRVGDDHREVAEIAGESRKDCYCHQGRNGNECGEEGTIKSAYSASVEDSLKRLQTTILICTNRILMTRILRLRNP